MPEKPLEELEGMVGQSRVTAEALQIERGKVAEFATAIGDDSPIYVDEAAARDAGFAGIPAPIPFTRTSFFPRYRPPGVDEVGFDLGFDFSRSLHGQHEFRFERPVLVDDTLTGTTTLEDVCRKEGDTGGVLTIATLTTRFRDERDDLVVTSTTTMIETAEQGEQDRSDESADVATRRPGVAAESAETGTVADSASMDWMDAAADSQVSARDDVSVGDSGPTFVIEALERHDFVRYAGASGDFYPLHYSEPYARAAGYPAPFAQGMLIAGFGATMLTRWFGLASVCRFRTRFTDVCYPGETLRSTGTVTDVQDASPDGVTEIEVELECVTDDGPILSGDATVVVPSIRR